MNGPDTTTDALLAQANPVPGDAFTESWREPHWQGELGKILAAPQPETIPEHRRRAWFPRRPGWRLAGLTAVAAAVLAVALVAVTGLQPSGHGRGPESGPPPGVFSWPSGLPGARPDGLGPARSVLLAVASTVAHRPAPTPGRYWRSDSVYGNFRPAGPSLDRNYMILERGSQSDWESPTATSGDVPSAALVTQWLGVQLASAADVAAWRRAGSPTTWPGAPDAGPDDLQGYADGNGGIVRSAAAKPILEFGGTGPSNLTYDGRLVSTLPATPELLRNLLSSDYREAGTGGISAWLFSRAPYLLTEPVTPAVRAAVYRLLASLPGARNLGTVRDIAGQEGTGIALDSTQPGCQEAEGMENPAAQNPPAAPCTVQQTLIINPATGMPLGWELRYLDPPGGETWPVPGGLFSYQLFGNSGWTNRYPPKS